MGSFKVGDKVRLKEDISGIDTWCIEENIIADYKEKVFTVSQSYVGVDDDGEFAEMALEEDGIKFSWNPELFELVTESEDAQ